MNRVTLDQAVSTVNLFNVKMPPLWVQFLNMQQRRRRFQWTAEMAIAPVDKCHFYWEKKKLGKSQDSSKSLERNRRATSSKYTYQCGIVTFWVGVMYNRRSKSMVYSSESIRWISNNVMIGLATIFSMH